MSRSVGMTRFAFSRRSASTARCFRGPRSTTTPSRHTSSGPRMRNCEPRRGRDGSPSRAGSAHRQSLGGGLAALWLDFRTAAQRGARHQQTTREGGTMTSKTRNAAESGQVARSDGCTRRHRRDRRSGSGTGPLDRTARGARLDVRRPARAGHRHGVLQPGSGPAADPAARADGRETYTAMLWTPAGDFWVMSI